MRWPRLDWVEELVTVDHTDDEIDERLIEFNDPGLTRLVRALVREKQGRPPDPDEPPPRWPWYRRMLLLP